MTLEAVLHLKHRPTTFKQVLGQDAAVKSLKNVVANKSSHAFLFGGPSGTGKTTLARITANALGCTEQGIREINGSEFTGVDNIREVLTSLRYRPLGYDKQAIILDEAHQLSKSAWNSMLKDVEEPPDWLYWFFCTTELAKVPASIKTRCSPYELQSVNSKDLTELVNYVSAQEGIKLHEEIVDVCVKEADGSPRQALVNLAAIEHCKTAKEAEALLKAAGDSGDAATLAKALIKGQRWAYIKPILEGLKDTNPESVRQVVRAYVTKVVMNTDHEGGALKLMEILAAFSETFNSNDGITPVVLACGRLLS